LNRYSLFQNKENDRERRKIESERVKIIEMRKAMRKAKRDEWASKSIEVDFDEKRKAKLDKKNKEEADKDGNDDKVDDEEEDKEQDKDEKDSSKKNDNTFKESVNEGSVTSNAFPATSTQDNMSVANPVREQPDSQMNPQNQQPSGIPQQNNMYMNNPQNNMQNNMNQNNQIGQNNQMSSRLPSLSSLPISQMGQQQNMMNPNMRLPPMFNSNQMQGSNYNMNSMGGMNMNFQGPTSNVFQGARGMNPSYNQNMGMYGNNMQMMQYQMGNQMNNQMYGNMMNYNPNMQGMMNYGQFQNPMMRNSPYGNQFQMLPPGQMPMTRGMTMNQQMGRNPNNLDNLIQGDQYVPGTLEDHAINALTNTDYNK